MQGRIYALLTLLLLWPLLVTAGEWSGYISAESRYFPQAPLDPAQAGSGGSLAAQPEYYREWDQGRQSLTITPFARWDQNDSARSHVDVRELLWLKAADSWELRAGIGKVFWGVTESQHLVDIINQTDFVESPDGEEKLGQPMLNLSLIRDWGTLDLFVLPGFRERSFPGRRGRLRPIPYVDTSEPVYTSAKKQGHVDAAARWSHYIGDWDFGLSYFRGTTREPFYRYLPTRNVLLPVYDVIDQIGIDIQATLGFWLWKLEAIRRWGQVEPFNAVTAGFEYTLAGLFDTSADLGVIMEYLYDRRGQWRFTPTPFANDLMLGLRLTPNDEQSTEFLLGIIVDLDEGSRLITLESSRRLGDSWKLTLEGQAFAKLSSNDILYGFRRDNYARMELAWYF